MPELPEVETVVRSVRPHIEGKRVADIWTSGKPLRLNRPLDLRGLRQFARGVRIERISRRAKYILVDVRLPDGQTGVWLIHLGMSGRLRVHPASEPCVPHTHVTWQLGDGLELRFSDPRRFGLVKAAKNRDAFGELDSLGPDPLTELTVQHLQEVLRGRRAPIKSVLLDQSRIAGLGNIYVCEALFYAGVHPATPATRAAKRAPELLAGIKRSLVTALENKGTTLRDFVDSDGNFGTHQDRLEVYGRAGEPCHRCGAPVRRRVDGGRSTFFCGGCQRR